MISGPFIIVVVLELPWKNNTNNNAYSRQPSNQPLRTLFGYFRPSFCLHQVFYPIFYCRITELVMFWCLKHHQVTKFWNDDVSYKVFHVNFYTMTFQKVNFVQFWSHLKQSLRVACRSSCLVIGGWVFSCAVAEYSRDSKQRIMVASEINEFVIEGGVIHIFGSP